MSFWHNNAIILAPGVRWCVLLYHAQMANFIGYVSLAVNEIKLDSLVEIKFVVAFEVSSKIWLCVCKTAKNLTAKTF